MHLNNPADREWSEAPTTPLSPDRHYTKAPRWPEPPSPDDARRDQMIYPSPPGYDPAGYPQPAPRPQTAPPPRGPSWLALHAAQIVALFFGVLEVLIAIRVVLKLLAANPVAEFSSFVYTFTEPFVAPFQGVFPTPAGLGSVLEISSILAIIVYALLGKLATRIAQLGQPRGPRF
jgi:uncharacterized protein YggT (Ycf19 family)